jgi:hypothetical protein
MQASLIPSEFTARNSEIGCTKAQGPSIQIRHLLEDSKYPFFTVICEYVPHILKIAVIHHPGDDVGFVLLKIKLGHRSIPE